MTPYDWIFIGLLSALFIFFKDARHGAGVILSVYIIYAATFQYIPDNYYHVYSSTLNLAIAIILFKDYVLFKIPIISTLSLLLIVVNINGYISYKSDLSATEYNESYLFVFSLEILVLFIRTLINAYLDRRIDKHALVQLVDFDRRQARATIHQRHSNKKA